MKPQSFYTENSISAATKINGAFWAFSDAQVKEQAIEGVKYVSLGSGLVCPENNAKALSVAFKQAIKAGREQDITENGKDAIIKRELYNHECFYTGDYLDCAGALSGYGISDEDITRVYRAELPNSDCF